MNSKPADPAPVSSPGGGVGRDPASRVRAGTVTGLFLVVSLSMSATARPTTKGAVPCGLSAALQAAQLGNWQRAAHLFSALADSRPCPARVWERAAEAWLRVEGASLPSNILRGLERAAARAPAHLSARIRALAARLEARTRLTGRPGRRAGLYSASSDGATGQAPIASLAPKGRMRVLARFDAPSWLDPVAKRDVSGRQVVYAASIRGDFLAVSAKGRVLWRRHVQETIREGLAGAKGILAAANDRHILLVDTSSGRVLARLHRPENCGPPRAILGRLEMICDKTLFAVSSSGLTPMLSQPEPMTAGPVSTTPKCQGLGRADGRVVSTCEGKLVPTTLKICDSPIVGIMGTKSGSIVAACRSGELVVVSGTKVLWKVSLPARPTSALALGVRRIYVGLVGLGLASLSKTGSYRDVRPAGATMAAGPVSDREGGLLVGGRDGRIHRWSEGTGPSWTIDVGADIDARPVVLDNGAVVLATTDGRVLIVD